MRILMVVIVFAWAGLHTTLASAQSIHDRWSVIPKAHAEEPPPDREPAAAPPEQTPTDPYGQKRQTPPAADTTVGSARHPGPPRAGQAFYGRASFYSCPKGKAA